MLSALFPAFPKSAIRRNLVFPVVVVTAFVLAGAGCVSRSKNEPANTLHVAVGTKIKGLDPIYADDNYSGTQLSYAYETLFQYHYLKRPYSLVPLLAEAMPEVSKDGKTYTIRLKKGVVFQDDPSFKATAGKGREMTADDVVYSFKRLADPKLTSTGWWLFDGKIVGLNQWRTEASQAGAADYAKAVDGLKSVDRYTVQITLVQRSGQFLYSLAMPFTSVVPREAVEHYAKEFLNHPVGTGPFRLVEFNPNSRLIWAKNPTYRQEHYPSEGEPGDQEAGLLADAGKPLPFSDRVVVQIIEESQPRWLNFMAGKLDYSGIPKDNYAQAITPGKDLSPDLKEKGVKLWKVPGLDITHFSFNMSDPLLGRNKLLRQALSVAYDEVTSIEIFFNGRAIPAQGPIPPGLEGYDPNFKNPYRQFNLEKAKELLAKAGYPEGKGLPALDYVTLSDSSSRQMNEYAQKVFGAIGVKLKVNAYSWPEFQSAVKGRRGQLWSFAWNADYPDPENFLQLFYGKNASPGSNDSNYANPEYDRLYEKLITLDPGPGRLEVIRRMVEIVTEDCPWIFGVHRLGYTLVHPWLKNLKPHEFSHNSVKYYRVDPALRK